MADAGERSTEALLDAAHTALAAFGVRADYLELVDPDTLEPLAALDRPALLAIAARVGGVRLIDNATLLPAAERTRRSADHPLAQQARKALLSQSGEAPAAPVATTYSSSRTPHPTTSPSTSSKRSSEATCSA